jgi:hypothetical protein
VQARDNDLVIATHGRSFWVLDDITPLYELNDSLANKDEWLFAPRKTMRMEGGAADTAISSGQNAPQGAIVRYYFKKKPASEVRLVFLTQSRDTITMYSSTKDKKREPIKIKKEFYEDPQAKRPGVLRADSGMNTFIWDLRHSDALEVEEGRIMQGSLAGPKVMPGKYIVQLLRGETLISERSFEVFEYPKIKISQEDLAEQMRFALELRDSLTSMHKTIKQIRKMRSSIEGYLASFGDSLEAKPLKESAKPLLDTLTGIEDALIQNKIKAGEDILRFPIKLNDKLAYLFDVVKTADAKPSDQEYDVFKELVYETGKEYAKLKQLEEITIPSFNRLASDKRRPVIELSKTY